MKQQEMVKKDERSTFALFSVVSNFARADSTLAGRKLTTSVISDDMGAPAFTNGKEITFNVDMVPSVTKVDGLVTVNGLNYHELAHCLYTPRSANKNVQTILLDVITHRQSNVNTATAHRAFNILEDNRIETLIIDQWPSTKPYLIATFAHYFAQKDAKQHEKVWPMAMGRSYLPKQVKRYFREEFENSGWCLNNQQSYARMQDIMREFKALSAPTHEMWWRDAMTLAVEYAELYPEIKAADDPFGNSIGDAKFSGEGDPQAGGQGGEGSDGDAEGDSDGTGEDGDDSDSTGAPGGDGESDSDQGGGNGAGQGSGSEGIGSFDDPKKALEDVVKQQAASPNVKQDVRRQQESMRPGNHSASALSRAKSASDPVRSEVKTNANKFGKLMRRLVTDADPGFHKGHSSGRVNVQRAMRGDSLDSVFDRWDAGRHDADSIEMVVLLDRSGSMSNMMQPVCEAAWQIKHGAESISANTKVTIIAFDDVSEILYSQDDPSSKTRFRSVGSRGGTNPSMGLVESIRIMNNSSKKHKAVIILTDGGWFGADAKFGNFNASPDEMIQRLNNGGVTTACYLMGGAAHTIQHGRARKDPNVEQYYDQYTHGAQVRGLVTNSEEFAAVSNSLVKKMVKG